jgi:Ino eighty subunit 1
MNYDPIHDTYIPTKDGEKVEELKVVDTSGVSLPASGVDGGDINIDGSMDDPSKAKAFAISNLVSLPGSNDEEDKSGPNQSTEEHQSLDHAIGSNNDIPTDEGKKKKRKYTNSTVPKCRHLKKADGEPFWRKDIQYDFLEFLFNDPTPAFTNTFPFCEVTNSNNDAKIPFTDLYIRTLVESSKCSKILKERLIKDKDMGKSVSKVCLLVNAGRMNTTINFVPEMRSTLRTYHSIPSLQSDPVYGGTRPLQDTPRLKSILKAVCEGEDHIKDLDELINNPKTEKPNTNVIQLIFLLSNYNHSVPFLDPEETTNKFMDFFLKTHIHPANRAKRFLWLMFTYLETKIQQDDLSENPFGGDVIPPEDTISKPVLDTFDKDTEFEIEYSEVMYKTRLKYLADEEHNFTPKRGNKAKGNGHAVSAAVKLEGPPFIENDPDADNVEAEPLKKRPATDEIESKKKARKTSVAHEVAVPSPLIQSVLSSEIIKNEPEPDYEKEDFDYRLIDLVTNLENIIFPLENFDKIRNTYELSHSIPTIPDESASVSNRINVVNTSKPVIRQVRTSSKASTASFNKKTTILGIWLYRYFRYKKTIGNKLLGIEWEDIRYDFVNGIEDYLYQQLGKSLNTKKLVETREDGDPNSNIKNVSELGFAYLPLHDFDFASERISFTLQLMSFCNDWLVRRRSMAPITKHEAISFDLENETVHFQ